MELEFINQLTGTGADSVTMMFGWILMRHHSRIKTLEGKV